MHPLSRSPLYVSWPHNPKPYILSICKTPLPARLMFPPCTSTFLHIEQEKADTSTEGIDKADKVQMQKPLSSLIRNTSFFASAIERGRWTRSSSLQVKVSAPTVTTAQVAAGGGLHGDRKTRLLYLEQRGGDTVGGGCRDGAWGGIWAVKRGGWARALASG